jgi:Glycine cleavage system protein P (pyridoxal-binding), N-terminal domain
VTIVDGIIHIYKKVSLFMRYLPLTDENRREMMADIGISSVDDLYVQVPKKAFIQGLANMPLHKGELEVERILSKYANQITARRWAVLFGGRCTTSCSATADQLSAPDFEA